MASSAGNLAGIVWVHEFGHNKGLDHRLGDGLLMNDFVNSTMR